MQTTADPARRRFATAAFDLAARACNAAEQIRVVEAVGEGEGAHSSEALSKLEGWRLSRLARGLASGWSGDPALAAPWSADELERRLAAHRLWQRKSRDWDETERELLADVHAAWLPAYVSALEGFDSAAAPDADLDVEGRPANRRLLARACAPFCQLLGRELAAAASAANAASGSDLIGPAFVAAFEGHLIDRFELSLAWAVEADQNVAFARRGIDRDSATPHDHRRYFERTFADAGEHHAFHLRFPVLARWLATVAQMLCDAGSRLVRLLARDVDELGRKLFDARIAAFTSVDLGKSDYHAGGRSVAIVHVALESGPASFVYKPRCLLSLGPGRRIPPLPIVSGTFFLDTPKLCGPDAPTHAQLNKDNPDSTEGRKVVQSGPNQGQTLFTLAFAAALDATKLQFERLSRIVG